MAAKKKAASKGKIKLASSSAAKTKSAARTPAKKAGKKAPAPVPARKTAAPAKPAAAAKPAAPASELLARRLVKLAASNAPLKLEELYTDDCVSAEPMGPEVRGIEGIRTKHEQWGAMTEHSEFKARNVLAKGNVIVIEWEGTVKLRDGRELSLSEVAVHELRGGKIASERYYYDPGIFGPPPAPEKAAKPAAAKPARPKPEPKPAKPKAEAKPAPVEVRPPEPLPPVEPPRGTPPVDPIDL